MTGFVLVYNTSSHFINSRANLKEAMIPRDKKPLKILMLLNRVPFPQNDGGAIAVYRSITGYKANNCDIHILSMNTTKHFVSKEKAMEVLLKFGSLDLVDLDNRIKLKDLVLNIFSRVSYILERFSSRHFNEKLIDILKVNQFDFIHAETLSCMLYADTIHQRTKSKLVYRAHNVEQQIWERSAVNESNPLKKWYLRLQANRLALFEREALNKADLILAISKEDEIAFATLTAKKVILLPAGMEVSSTTPNLNIVNDLFFIGSFDWLPNLQGLDWFFQNIWSEVKKNFPSIHLFIAGKQMPESFLQLNDERITALGEVPDSKQFMLEHGVMIVPLVSGSGVRIKIVEAMALGKTIIATTIAAEGLGLTNGENILIADNAEQFTAQLKMCADLEFVKKIGVNAHSFALENFQNKRIFEKLTNYYCEII